MRSQKISTDTEVHQPQAVAIPNEGRTATPALLFQPSMGCTTVSIHEILPCIGKVACDENGSRFLKACVSEASRDVQAMLFGAALHEMVEASMDKFGHSFILRLVEVATSEQQKVIVEKLFPHVRKLSLDTHGCYVIQKALQLLPLDCCEQLINGLREGTAECIKSRHGNHVIQVCLQRLPAVSVSFILNAVESLGVAEACTHVCACRIVMRLLEHMPRQQMNKVLQRILQSVPKLVRDRFGNYVLQHFLERGDMVDKRRVIDEILKCDIVELGKQRYAHNVIVKCIQIAFSLECAVSLELERAALSKVFLQQQDDNTKSAVMELASDRFGSVVVQCLMDHRRKPILVGSGPSELQQYAKQ